MRRLILYFAIAAITLPPATGYSIVFKKKDEKGSYHFLCDGFSGSRVKIKIIEKNTYKVLGSYVGKIVMADSPIKAAQIVCGEVLVKGK